MEQSAASREDVDAFVLKLQRKGRNTLGLFIAISGFSKPAVRAHSERAEGVVMMDGTDLMGVLDGRITLPELLDAKRRHLSETGNPLYLLRDILSP